MNEKKRERRLLKYLVWFVVAVLVVIYFQQGLSVMASLLKICSPLILGCVLAFALNIVLKMLEKIYFPRSGKAIVIRSRRLVCTLLSIILIAGILALVIVLVVPEFLRALTLIANEIPVYFESLKNWLLKYSDQFPIIADTLEGLNIDWNSTLKEFVLYALSGVGSIFNSTITFISTLGSGIVNVVIGVIFAVFILLQKEKLQDQLQRVMRLVLKETRVDKINGVFSVANRTFAHFVSGQCLEAVILGGLCILGMLIFGFPYAPMIGAVIGITALIPMVGAFIGAGIGAFMILTVDPMKALFFIIFIIVLQQIESNLIYPKVVGASVGLPGIWVLAAIILGGGIGGILGMMVAVPVAATLYKLLQAKVRRDVPVPKAEET
ncbi:Predicted PurR-regulated permease PerM [Sporobacter termitidis DSM 10068]|uniref:Predicted PurR-regulated permease PerM n=1 Tax=Sporobacter termitidis DSM 10068 TaxID=1123282 RepID=A0A1M5Y3R3_9FIRM|nr:AI-2E family transporter [Sporobacter termitidis]SHI06642.1 Predicted PurR-regulated permease PerM [Sporobacter termitidis DSM 10068]